ncbi:MAG: sulfotransferase [Rhodospirillales bacterium]
MSGSAKRPTIPVPGAAPSGAGQRAPVPDKRFSQLKSAIEQFQAGNLRAAEKHAKAFLKTMPGHPDGLHLIGIIAFQNGQTAKAIDQLGRAVRAGGKSADHFKNYAFALKSAARFEEALSNYDAAARLAPEQGAIWNDRGNVLVSLARYHEAEQSFRRAIELQPGDPKPYVNLGSLLTDLDRTKQAVEVCRKAVKLAPQLAAAHNELGSALRASGDFEAALACFREALRLDPGSRDAANNLAAAYEETSRLDDARAVCGPLLAKFPGDPGANLIMARCDRRDGDIEAALKHLDAIDDTGTRATLRRDIAFERSKLQDRLGNAVEAFQAMSDANALAMQASGVDESMGESFISGVAALQAWVSPAAAEAVGALERPADEAQDPVFLVGFPRSGTTLLGQVLDSHSGLVMAEEQPFLDQIVNRLRSAEPPYPEAITRMSADEIAEYRALYFAGVDGAFDRRPGQRIVDKFPLHLVHTGLITALFPGARFILALRHPCDVVLSCFMQSFVPNPAMANFYSIERTAMTYDRVLTLWQAYEEHFDPVRYAIRYEDVVEDFDRAIEALLAFLDLPWEDAVRAFSEHARARGPINTPSYSQVTEKLYTRARYRWLRYREQLAPAMPDLDPWIERLGYAETGE